MNADEIARWMMGLDDEGFEKAQATLSAVLRSELSRRAQLRALSFKPGDKVEFDGRGSKWTGTVTKVNQTTVSVRAKEMNPLFGQPREQTWRVHASLLRKVICERQFDFEDPARSGYSLDEVDYYAHLPSGGGGVADHRLSLRKNLRKGEFEVYRAFMVPVQVTGPGYVFQTAVDEKKEQVLLATESLEDAMRFAEDEWKRRWGHIGKGPSDQVCDHVYGPCADVEDLRDRRHRYVVGHKVKADGSLRPLFAEHAKGACSNCKEGA